MGVFRSLPEHEHACTIQFVRFPLEQTEVIGRNRAKNKQTKGNQVVNRLNAFVGNDHKYAPVRVLDLGGREGFTESE